jgi:hypothetical protein
MACYRENFTFTFYRHTLKKYVIFIAFSLQKWLHERASMLCFTYIACLVSCCKGFQKVYFSLLVLLFILLFLFITTKQNADTPREGSSLRPDHFFRLNAIFEQNAEAKPPRRPSKTTTETIQNYHGDHRYVLGMNFMQTVSVLQQTCSGRASNNTRLCRASDPDVVTTHLPRYMKGNLVSLNHA